MKDTERKIEALERRLKYARAEIQEYKDKLRELECSSSDWYSVQVDTPILYKDPEDSTWRPGYFAGLHETGKPMVFDDGYTSRLTNASIYKEHMKLDPDAKSIINWIDNPGYCPEHVLGKTIMTKLQSGAILLFSNIYRTMLNWSLVYEEKTDTIIKYAIIE